MSCIDCHKPLHPTLTLLPLCTTCATVWQANALLEGKTSAKEILDALPTQGKMIP